MQNEELQRVFNISGNPNHRYNGYVLPISDEKSTNKNRKHNTKPKKSHTVNNMVTAPTKNIIKRKSRLKNSACKSEDSLMVNGINSINSFSPKQKEFNSYIDKYRINNINNECNPYEDNSLASINSFISKLKKNLEPNSSIHNRMQVANVTKHSEVNHMLHPESSAGSVNYSRNINQYSSLNNEYGIKVNTNSVTNQKFNNVPFMGKTKKYNDLGKKDVEFSHYISDISSYESSVKNNSQYDECVSDKQTYLKENPKFVDKSSNKILSTMNTSNVCENKLYLRARRRKQNQSKWQMDSGTRHEALQRIRDCVELQENLQNDLFPLNVGETGIEKSDSDSSEEYLSTYQNHWFHSMAEIEFDDVKRSLRLGQLCKELRRQFSQIKSNKYELPTHSEKFMKSLIQVARTRPSAAIRYLPKREQISTVEPLTLTKHKCAVENCKNVALPCMPTCVRHLLLCKKQTLFEQCRVRNSNSFQCDRPVLNNKFHYPVCSLHSKPDFVLPDLSRDEIKYDNVRNKSVSTSVSEIYKTDFEFGNGNVITMSSPSATTLKSEVNKKRNHTTNASKVNSNVRLIADKKEKASKKITDKNDNKPIKNETKQKSVIIKPKEVLNIKEKEATPIVVSEANQNLLRDWVHISDNQLVDVKTLENNLQNEFVNGFDINASSIQSHIQDIINSESSLSTDMLSMESHDIQNYIKVEEMIEEVEITDETLDSTELSNTELVHSEDLNAVLKHLPPEAFSELFSDKNDSQWGETQTLERVIEEMDVRKCTLIDPSLLLEDIEPSYSNYTVNYDTSSINENLENKFTGITKNCSQSQT